MSSEKEVAATSTLRELRAWPALSIPLALCAPALTESSACHENLVQFQLSCHLSFGDCGPPEKN
jgi:hypothetical protein